MTFTPKDHARLFDDLGRQKVARRIVNREFEGDTLERAREWLAQANASRTWRLTQIGIAFAGASAVLALVALVVKALTGS